MFRASATSLLLLIGLAAPAAAQTCLTDSQPIEGDLAQIKTRTQAGRDVAGYVLQLERPTCVEVTDLDGAPAELSRVANVQILATDLTGERALRRLLGARISVIGNLDAPDPDRHAGQAVLSNAELVSVLRSAGSDQGDGGDAQQTAATDSDTYGSEADSTTVAEETSASEPSDDYQPEQPKKKIDPDRADLEARLERFVENFYLSGENIEPDVIRTIYAPRVNYFGKRNTPVSRIVKDKLAYYNRWPSRQFTLMPGTLEVRRIGYEGQIYDLSFVYNFDVAAAGRKRGGRGYARVQIDMSDGKGRIIRESGKVIERRS